MITEVFVSLDGLNFSKIDIENDESIPMRYTFKDTQDISKVFSPYSLGFTFKASPNNLKSLGFFGNTDVVKYFDLRKLKCKVYVNSILNQNGILKLEKTMFKMGEQSVITASFTTNMTSLGEKMANDTINLLGSKPVDWLPSIVAQRVQSIKSDTIGIIPIKYFVPLASTNRVFQYDPSGSGLDNVFYQPANLPTSNNVLRASELRPAITLSTIVDLVKLKYGLDIIIPLESQKEYKDAYIWCMGEDFGNQGVSVQYDLKSNVLGPIKNFVGVWLSFSSLKYVITSNIVNNTFKIVRNLLLPGWSEGVLFRIDFLGLYFLGEGEKTVTITLNRLGSTEKFLTQTFDIVEGNVNEIVMVIQDAFFISNEIEFQANVQFNSPVIWNNSKPSFFFNYVLDPQNVTTFFYQSVTNFNFAEMGGSKIDLIKALPKIKVLDFITSLFKSFNIAVLDVTPNNDSLYWYTPQDILENKKEVTYTADISIVEKSVQDDFNYYVFKHATSKFRSNVDYKTATVEEYGQASFPIVKPAKAKEYKVETNFTIIPPVKVIGANNITTMYGFQSGNPNLLDTGESRYKPNFGEMVLFYSHGNKPLNRSFGFQSSLLNGNLINLPINSYIEFLPYTTDAKSFSWSVLVNNNIAYPNTLFLRYYVEIIKRYINQNVMKQEFSLTLTAEEIRNFRLENDIVIGENKFTIIDSTIDITTGKTKLTLLNY